MRVEKRVLNDALRVLGKVVCQTSPVLYVWSTHIQGAEGVDGSIRFQKEQDALRR